MLRVSEYAGFCPGVKRATDAVEAALANPACGRVAMLDRLIHNRLYLEDLCRRGATILSFSEVEDFFYRDASPMTLFIRAHGITKEQFAVLKAFSEKEPDFHLADMTCPFVARVHKIAEENTGSDTVFLLFCDATHAEAIGTMSYATGEKYTFQSKEELDAIQIGNKSPILCAQTTQNAQDFDFYKKYLKKHYTNAKIFDTICNVTESRQKDAVSLAKCADRMIVVGSKDSSNTHRLFDLCRELCPATLWIESAADLPEGFSDDGLLTALTAGASTPDGIIMEVIKQMEDKNLDFSNLIEGSIKTLHTGDTVTGTVETINENEITLDLGAKVTGVLSKEQITDDPAAKLADMYKIGDEISVFVIRVEDGKGLATVSKKRVDRDNNWVILKAAHESGEILEGIVSAVVKGGVIVTVSGAQAFVPASQTGIAKGGDIAVLNGTKQRIKVLEFDEERKRAIASIKVILNAERKEKEDAIWAGLEVGQHFMGTVKSLMTFGAFVDIGGVDGLVHNSELSWKRIKHPSAVVSVGQQIEVFIKELNVEEHRISLGYKTQEMDSWYQFTKKFNVGDVVKAKIVSIMPFGAFAEVYEGVDGLIHISRISTKRINNPSEVLSVGDVVDVKITEIDDENRRLALSIRALTEEAEKAAAAEAKAAEDAARAEEKAARDAERKAEEEKEAQERADMAPYIVGTID